MKNDTIKIDGTEHEITDLNTSSYTLPYVELDDGTEWYLAENSEEAGQAARDYWEDMADNDPKELTCMIGEDNLIAWALGQSAAPGSIGVSSLSEWLDLWLDVPNEHFAGYDGNEAEVESVSENVSNELGFTPTVAYRNN